MLEDSFLDSQVEEFLKRTSFSRHDVERGLNRYRPPQISITALSGAGKSSLMKGLERELGSSYRYVSGGTFMRSKAQELGMTIEEFSWHVREYPEKGYDKECDSYLLKQAIIKPGHLIMESRIAHVWTLGGFHVFLTCPLALRAERRLSQIRKENPSVNINLGGVMGMIHSRDAHNIAGYDKLYPGWNWSEIDYDLVVDTSQHDEAQVLELVLDGYTRWRQPALRRAIDSINTSPMCCAAL